MEGERILVPYEEVRQLLGGIGRSTLYNLIDTDKLTRVSIGRRGFITRDSLDGYVVSLTGNQTVGGDLP